MSTQTAEPKTEAIENLSTAELQEILDSRLKKEREAKDRQRLAYEDLKANTVCGLAADALLLHERLADYKKRAFEQLGTLYQLLLEYSDRAKDGKGNFRIEHGDYRIDFKRQGKPSFDERADQAEKHIIEFVEAKFKGDQDTRDLIMSLLERKNGDLDVALIQKLYAMEDRFDDSNWKRGIALLKESYRYSHSKDYVRIYYRDENSEWQPINLNFSNV